MPARKTAPTTKLSGVNGDRPAGADPCDDEAGRRRAADLSEVESQPEQCVRLL